MHIQFNTDNRITGDEALAAQAEQIVESRLNRFSSRLSRVDRNKGAAKYSPAE